jgi:hypothetical protein
VGGGDVSEILNRFGEAVGLIDERVRFLAGLGGMVVDFRDTLLVTIRRLVLMLMGRASVVRSEFRWSDCNTKILKFGNLITQQPT